MTLKLSVKDLGKKGRGDTKSGPGSETRCAKVLRQERTWCVSKEEATREGTEGQQGNGKR